jgi:transposase-like protein
MCEEGGTFCCGENKLCALTCCPCNLDLDVIKPLVNNPKFICQSCGRVANEAENLCKPVAL